MPLILSVTFLSLHSEYLPSHWVLPWRIPAPTFPSASSICAAHSSPELTAASTAANDDEHEEDSVEDRAGDANKEESHALSELTRFTSSDAARNVLTCFSENRSFSENVSIS